MTVKAQTSVDIVRGKASDPAQEKLVKNLFSLIGTLVKVAAASGRKTPAILACFLSEKARVLGLSTPSENSVPVSGHRFVR